MDFVEYTDLEEYNIFDYIELLDSKGDVCKAGRRLCVRSRFPTDGRLCIMDRGPYLRQLRVWLCVVAVFF